MGHRNFFIFSHFMNLNVSFDIYLVITREIVVGNA